MAGLALHGTALVDGQLDSKWVLVDDGRITSVSDVAPETGAVDETVELGEDQLLLPAATDLHVHCRDWGEYEEDTIATATRAALAGGVTTVCDQSNTKPRIDADGTSFGRVNTIERIEARVSLHKKDGYADFGVYASPPLDRDEIDEYATAGAVGVKFFPWDLPRWAMPLELHDTLQVAQRAQKNGLKLYAHPEEFSFKFTPYAQDAERYGLQGLLRWVTPELDMRLKLSSAASVARILEANAAGFHFRAHATPHTLYLSEEDAKARIGEGCLVSPPLRTGEEVARMQEFLTSGAFEFYASEHTPHTLERKYDRSQAPFQGHGFSSVEIAYAVLLSQTDDAALTCRLYCENPAAYLGISKGVIAEGYDADLVVMDRREWIVDPTEFRSLGKITPFIGKRLHYRVARTYLRGQQVYDAGSGSITKVPTKHVRAGGVLAAATTVART